MTNNIIEIKLLEKSFNSNSKQIFALKEVNLNISKGDIFGIIGTSGAGKSTLVRCINLLEIPSSGQVIFNGENIANLDKKQLKKLRQSIGMIFQNFNLLMQHNVFNNVCLPMDITGMDRKIRNKRVHELLKIVDLEEKITAYPCELSGGQKQRVAIARALALNPKVIICDEATSALDPTTTLSILSLLKNINNKFGVTVIIVTHEMDVVQEICNKVAVMDKGQIVETDNVNEIFYNSKTETTKKLIYPNGKQATQFSEKGNFSYYKIMFDSNTILKPIIFDIVMVCKVPVNIIYADTKNMDDKIFGQFIIQISDEKSIKERLLHFLEVKELKFKEVNFNDGNWNK